MKKYIYKLINDDGLFYIGSTKKNPNQRLIEHKSSYKTKTLFISSSCKLFENNKNVKIEVLEELENIDSNDLKKIENEHIKKNYGGNCVNKRLSIFDKDFNNEKRRKKYLLKKQSLNNRENKDNNGIN